MNLSSIFRRSFDLRDGFARRAAASGLIVTIAAVALSGCTASIDGANDEEATLGTIEQEFLIFPPYESLAARVNAGSSIKICLTGTGVNAVTLGLYQDWIRDAIMEWVNGMAPAAIGNLISSSDVSFGCSNSHFTVDWSADDGDAYALGEIYLFADSTYPTVLHEFGHAFGLLDTYGQECTNGLCQPFSVMRYALSSTLQPDDRQAIEEVYCMVNPQPSKCARRYESDIGWCGHSTGQLHLGDFNGDGRTDMLCHDISTGAKWIDRANSQGKFGNTDWSTTAAWCNHSTGQLYVGDFNGDGRDDIMCHDVSNGHKWVDYASTSGRFEGGEWSTTLGWCGHSTGVLKIADFNGDGYDDLMCEDRVLRMKWFDYADGAGHFSGTDWSMTLDWCNHGSGQLLIGDFNADRRGDLMCHDVDTGTLWIDYADEEGHFAGAEFIEALGWCTYPGHMLIEDFNGDDRDDLLCHNQLDGYKEIAMANRYNNFGGTSRGWPMNWCYHSGSQLFVGDFKGNGVGDFLCHDRNTGKKWQAFQTP